MFTLLGAFNELARICKRMAMLRYSEGGMGTNEWLSLHFITRFRYGVIKEFKT